MKIYASSFVCTACGNSKTEHKTQTIVELSRFHSNSQCMHANRFRIATNSNYPKFTFVAWKCDKSLIVYTFFFLIYDFRLKCMRILCIVQCYLFGEIEKERIVSVELLALKQIRMLDLFDALTIWPYRLSKVNWLSSSSMLLQLVSFSFQHKINAKVFQQNAEFQSIN